MSKVVILGSGAAPGVPALANGFGDCDSHNPKNVRLRSGTYYEISGVKFLMDTSPDLRMQLLNNNIRCLDAVFYTHVHADHLHGIDDLREINRICAKPIDVFASPFNMGVIHQRFGYLLTDEQQVINPKYIAALSPHVFEYEKPFEFKGLKVTPTLLEGHNVEVSGYIFNDGEVVHIADFHHISDRSLSLIKKRPELLVMPLTTPKGSKFHAGLDDLIYYAKEMKAKRVIITHMAVECDYEKIKNSSPDNMEPAYDGMSLEW